MKIKKVLFSIVLIINSITTQAQTDTIVKNELDEVILFSPIEVSPNFPRGDRALMCFIENHLNFELLNQVDTAGLCAYSFTIDTLGYCRFNKLICILE